ncbi:hypothetical protein [Polaromonas sp. CG_9.11]|uniref:hypothetical protein n=1 Tax=Polaromonas sp. CG_9.11 TaxID=2787730 RepID=UPI0018CA6889|nr:hypothetical protein [Polaromonas sp. CG_9.11]MBG6076695.1 hypothetical protein [Polaromonas sp. CG_9.11]
MQGESALNHKATFVAQRNILFGNPRMPTAITVGKPESGRLARFNLVHGTLGEVEHRFAVTARHYGARCMVYGNAARARRGHTSCARAFTRRFPAKATRVLQWS